MGKPRSIAQLKEFLETITDPNDERLPVIRQDPRKGAALALKTWERQIEKQRLLEEKFTKMLQFERSFWSNGSRFLAGIDEVGRGPLAGPVVAAAVILPQDFHVLEINDSKQLSEKKREELFERILNAAFGIGIGVKDHSVIDEINIYQAAKSAMVDAVQQLPVVPDQLLIDAMNLPLDIPQKNLSKGDAKSLSIAAASIVAKVTRDRMMEEYDALYPGYGFAKNAGYGTKVHLEGLQQQGPCPIHRKSFAPVQNCL